MPVPLVRDEPTLVGYRGFFWERPCFVHQSISPRGQQLYLASVRAVSLGILRRMSMESIPVVLAS
jgi:hypothetical protein